MDLQSISGKALDEFGESLDPMVIRRVFSDTAVSLGGSEVKYQAPESDENYRQRISEQIEVKKNGGPAFGEFHQTGDCSIKTGGMSLRDYFAAKAMQSILSNSEAMECAAIDCSSDTDVMANVADRAYAIADAMLAERAK